MKHVLIIEDNTVKEQRMRQALRGIADIEFTVCRSIKAAYPLLDKEKWNVVLLDMSFQSAADSATDAKKDPLAGRQILQVMRAKQLRSPVIVVTQNPSFARMQTTIASLEELHEKFSKYFPGIYRSTILANLTSEDWYQELVVEVKAVLDER